jgi:hypothetical protein
MVEDKFMYDRIKMKRLQVVIVLAIALVIFLTLTALYLAGCTDTLKGELYENQPPIVYFANIPPDGYRTGRNLVVYWYGTDKDGLIDYYRYLVVTVAEVGQSVPEDYIAKVPDTAWTYVDVDPSASNPQTAHAISLRADPNDPVNTFVDQWVFLQAFDMEGLGSDIIFRRFPRNDNPPETRIYDFSTHIPFVDGDSGGIVSGVKMNWDGSDPDYSREPVLEFHWRLYGPYTDSTFKIIKDSFIAPVFLTTTGKVYNLHETMVFCDTFPDSVHCYTFEVTDPISDSAKRWGALQHKFFVDDPKFIARPELNKVADSSFDGVDEWVTSKTTTMYNVYRHYAQTVEGTTADTTVQMRFIFWIRCRDDALVADLVPAFADSLPVIRPRYEREVAVIDFTSYPGFSGPTMPDPILQRVPFWYNAIHRWDPAVVFEFDTTELKNFGTSPDYLLAHKSRRVPLMMLLKHKVVILYDDDIKTANFAGINKAADNVYTAIDAGVNVWLTMRASLNTGQGGQQEPNWIYRVPSKYTEYFGVTMIPYSGWDCFAHGTKETGGCGSDISPPYGTACPRDRIEDFIGAYALDPTRWPNLDVDTTLLRTRLRWEYQAYRTAHDYGPCYAYEPEHPGLPEVDWSARLSTTQALYLYKSSYGSNHPRGGNFNMEGNPVALRYNAGLFRTAHFNFTPLVIDSVQMQIVIDSVLNWLSESPPSSPTSAIRYPDAPVKMSVSEARERYWRRVEEQAKKEGL